MKDLRTHLRSAERGNFLDGGAVTDYQNRAMRKFLISLLWVGVPVACLAIGLVVMAVIGLALYYRHQERKFERLEDTRDLRVHAAKIANQYLSRRTNGALVIGVIQKGKVFSAGFGRVSDTNTAAPDASTVFEIGSVSKAYTGVLLARMVKDGEVRLQDSITNYLPAHLTLPPELRPITLAELATHSAGLPRLPDNLDLSPANLDNPYARYTTNELYAWLANAKLASPPRSKSDYSNVGAGLLGHLLELRAGKPYEQLVREKICAPLDMPDTAVTLSAEQRSRMATGHKPRGTGVASNWDFQVLAPAGGLRSTVGDQLKFIQANLADANPALDPALALARETHYRSWLSNVGLCWHIDESFAGLRVVWHNGGTGGYVSFVAFDRKQQTGVVLLSSYGDALVGDDSLDKIGMELIRLATKVSWE